jgi:hypothetical protein
MDLADVAAEVPFLTSGGGAVPSSSQTMADAFEVERLAAWETLRASIHRLKSEGRGHAPMVMQEAAQAYWDTLSDTHNERDKRREFARVMGLCANGHGGGVALAAHVFKQMVHYALPSGSMLIAQFCHNESVVRQILWGASLPVDGDLHEVLTLLLVVATEPFGEHSFTMMRKLFGMAMPRFFDHPDLLLPLMVFLEDQWGRWFARSGARAEMYKDDLLPKMGWLRKDFPLLLRKETAARTAVATQQVQPDMDQLMRSLSLAPGLSGQPHHIHAKVGSMLYDAGPDARAMGPLPEGRIEPRSAEQLMAESSRTYLARPESMAVALQHQRDVARREAVERQRVEWEAARERGQTIGRTLFTRHREDEEEEKEGTKKQRTRGHAGLDPGPADDDQSPEAVRYRQWVQSIRASERAQAIREQQARAAYQQAAGQVGAVSSTSARERAEEEGEQGKRQRTRARGGF